jgi:hypothetical protein
MINPADNQIHNVIICMPFSTAKDQKKTRKRKLMLPSRIKLREEDFSL